MNAIASLATALPSSPAPGTLHLLPAGEFRAVDGRPADAPAWRLDKKIAHAIISDAAARKNPYVLDYEHQTLHAAQNGKPAPAAGWFKHLAWREGVGLLATDVTYTAAAQAMITAGEYRYVSAVFEYAPDGRVLRLLHAGLVNTPALDGLTAVKLAALAALYPTTGNPMNEMLVKLLEKYGLTPGDSEEENWAVLEAHLDALTAQLAELGAAQAALKSAAPVSVVAALQAQVAALQAAQSAGEVQTLVAAGLADGRILKPMESWARSLAVADLQSYLNSAQPIAALKSMQSGGVAGMPPSGPAALSEVDRQVMKQLGLTEAQYLKGAT